MLGYLSLIIAAIGLVIYFATKTNAELKEVGRICFFCGLLAFLLSNGERLISLVSK